MPNLELINVGQAPNDKEGDPLRDAMQKVNLNFSALNTAIQGVLDTKGKANGYASLDANGRQPVSQFPLSAVAVADANNNTTPGVYFVNSDASATAALNWPVQASGVQLAGTLVVEAAASGNQQVTQTFTTRNGAGGVLRTFKRVRFGTTGVWGLWQEQARFDEVMKHVFLTSATDATTLTADNTFFTWRSGTVVTGGTNWPPAANVAGGSVEVRWTASDLIIQTVTLTSNNARSRVFQRIYSGSAWQAWKIIAPISTVGWLPTADCGDVYVDGLGWHKWSGSAYVWEGYATALPTTEHDLNTYLTTGRYRQVTNAGAAAGTNYPTAVAGYLEVISGGSGNTNCKQEYTVSSSSNVAPAAGPRKFWRMQTGTSTWSPWQEVLTVALGMTHTFLTAATDANTLTTDNTFYTWAAAAVSGGDNFPGYSSAGSMMVFWHASTLVSQELSLLVTGGKPLKFARFGNPTTGVWGLWKVVGAFNNTSWMPASNMGDIYVDGVGWHRWNGSAYELMSLAALLPTAAHDLNNYLTPGDFVQSSSAGAAAGSNYPVAVGGFLKVTQAGSGVNGTVQEYTVRSAGSLTLSSGPRKFWRVRDGSTWSAWQEVLAAATGMTHAFLTAAADANTLTADSTFYTWTSSGVLGSNFPAFATNWPAAGYMRVYYGAASQVSQELTYLVTGQKPRTFFRFGSSSTGVWQPWKSTSAWSSAIGLPTTDCGDIYVDGVGWYAWDGSAYKLTFAGRDHGQCRFEYISATQCRLVPYNGNGIIINGRQERIQAAGVNISNAAFTPGALGFVYSYMNGAAMTLEASSTVPVMDSNGIMVKTGDVSRTLVGMAIASSGDGEFKNSLTQRHVSSFFNRLPRAMQSWNTPSTSSDSYVQLNNALSFLAWAGDVTQNAVSGQTNSTSRSGSYIRFAVNGVQASGGYGYSLTSGAQVPFSVTHNAAVVANALYAVVCQGLGTGAAGTVNWGFDQQAVVWQ